MKKYIFGVLLCLFFTPLASAQITVEVLLEQEHFLPQEDIPVKVRIRNSSGQTLTLGSDNEWLSLNLETIDGTILPQVTPPDVKGEFTLPSAHRANKVVNLTPHFRIRNFGRYQVSASVRVPDWGKTFDSKPKVFDINTGVNLWQTVFGLPLQPGETRPEFRKYLLVQANHLKELSLYVRITNEDETHTYKLFPLGPLISFSKPEPQLDRWSNLHILFQDGARSFRYTAITPEGLILARQTHDISGSRPALTSDPDGRISVAGGVRRISASDLPPPDLQSDRPETPGPRDEAKPVDGKPEEK